MSLEDEFYTDKKYKPLLYITIISLIIWFSFRIIGPILHNELILQISWIILVIGMSSFGLSFPKIQVFEDSKIMSFFSIIFGLIIFVTSIMGILESIFDIFSNHDLIKIITFNIPLFIGAAILGYGILKCGLINFRLKPKNVKFKEITEN